MTSEERLIGTWTYRLDKAPFGFRKGKLLFSRDGGTLRARLRFLGFTIECGELRIDRDTVTFNASVEQEKVSIKLTLSEDRMTGTVFVSDFTSAIKAAKLPGGSNPEQDPDHDAEKPGNGGSPAPRMRRRPVLTPSDRQDHIRGSEKVHTFYYGWYGSPENDGDYRGWNHGVVPHKVMTGWNDQPPYAGGDDIASNYYPELGCYSSRSREVIGTHMRQLRQAGIGVAAVSWWGEGHYTDQSVPDLLATAAEHGVKIVFHIEPFYETAAAFRAGLEYLHRHYLGHPAIYRIKGRPLYYLYNSFVLEHGDWAALMQPGSETSIRDTVIDGVFISLWTTPFDGDFTVASGFDGFYTYFVCDGFSYGSTTDNWPTMASFARENGLIYVPCVGPGYVDTRIRPWNDENTRARDGGRYFEKMALAAMAGDPDIVAITSFNEWFEGTQIEPAVANSVGSFAYEDYGGEPDFYLKKTRELVDHIIVKAAEPSEEKT